MQTIHPFPARMAPEICSEVLGQLPRGSRILDPMCGSGTVLRRAVELGHDATGIDMDPLAVKLATAWTTNVPAHRLVHDANVILSRAGQFSEEDVLVPWKQEETGEFVDYWFARRQQDQLLRLAQALRSSRLTSLPLLWVCLSRLIVTKDSGASLARDVSHSRPHRTRIENDFDVFEGFRRAARLVAARLQPERIIGTAEVALADARDATRLDIGVFDAAITSPPYLNAIDYLRGHRLALVWMGYEVRDLRVVRSEEIGAERTMTEAPFDVEGFIYGDLAARQRGWVHRYADDMLRTATDLRELVRIDGTVVLVVGNSFLRGAAVDNAGIVKACCERVGLRVETEARREIPARRRYLPPPSGQSALSKRMREESVLTARVVAA